MLDKKSLWDEKLIRRYDLSGPRYTSYPTAIQFDELFTADDCLKAAQQSQASQSPLSLYVHIPFCAHVCYYCACNKVITKHRDRAQPYLDRLYKDIEKQAELFSGNRVVNQLHWGGGTPTFISDEQMRELMNKLKTHFNLLNDDTGDYSIEIDPREASPETLATLRDIGFNRISLGVQDFDSKVQQAVNRVQSEAQTRLVLEEGRRLGFKSINIDLIYGLPFQTPETFATTVSRVLDMSPDRLSVFNYAHMPHRFKPQRRINESELPTPDQKLTILHQTIDTLIGAGYQYIGMDHFAKPEDELSIAQQNHKLHRNFQGYTTHSDCDLVSMGVSAISQVGLSYYQNHHDIEEYQNAIDRDELPVKRGVWLSEDDLIRRDAIMQLICHFELDMAAFETAHQLDFETYFSKEMSRMQQFVADGLVNITDKRIVVRDSGRLLIRAICKQFDKYIPDTEAVQGFSRII
ncbi:MAG: oxygen-independent coproporphyrinogen III oxidase [Hahellaceae bacterium]|nr:oxygen-independent coproporphyrinogen III oxidase [Hahellaceae bacterium]